MRLLPAVILGGILFPCTFLLLDTYYPAYLSVLQRMGIVSLLLVAIGCFISIGKLEKWAIRLSVTLGLVIISYLIFGLIVNGGIKKLIENDFLELIVSIVLFGILGGYFKADLLKAKLNPVPQKSPEELYFEAETYRMNLVVRIFGVLVGFLFLLSPLLLFLDLKELQESFSSLELTAFIFLIVLFMGASSLGLFFLAYCIPGRTPQLILSYMKKRLNKKS